MSDEGYIAISRKLFKNALWTEKREFSKLEAWIDLIQSACWSESQEQYIDGNLIQWGRGQVCASTRFMQKRWGWGSASKVLRFIDVLEKQGMCEKKTEQGVTILTLCKYGDYNGTRNSDGTVTEQTRNSDGTNRKKEIQVSKESIVTKVTDANRKLYEKIESKDMNSIAAFIDDYKPDFGAPYMDLWNLFAEKFGKAKLLDLKGPRRGKLASRLKDPLFDFVKILKSVRNQSFAMEGKWFGFDWIVANETNFRKVLEGSYASNDLKDVPAVIVAPPKITDSGYSAKDLGLKHENL